MIHSDQRQGTAREYEDRFVAFIDILGFKEHVSRTERAGELTLESLLKATQLLGTDSDVLGYRKHGPTTCPHAPRFRNDLDFRITQVSDCAIISCEVSEAAGINLVAHCWKSVLRLLSKGFLCRGHICRGKIFHEGNHIIGPAYQQAVVREKEVDAFKRDTQDKGTPFVTLDESIADFLKNASDNCVRKTYHLFVKEASGISVIFPYACLRHNALDSGIFDADNERARNNEMRRMIQELIDGVGKFIDISDEKASKKYQHYQQALAAQIAECDVVDWDIDFLAQTVPKRIGDA